MLPSEPRSSTGDPWVPLQIFDVSLTLLLFALLQGYKNIIQNCTENAQVLKEGIERTGRFEVLSKDVGVPLVAFVLKDSSKHTVFDVAESLRRYGWIVPAYTMPADAQHIAVLRVVIREDFNRSLAMRLVADIEKVLAELEVRANRVSMMAATATKVASGDEKHAKKTVEQIQEEVTRHWKRFVQGRKTGVC